MTILPRAAFAAALILAPSFALAAPAKSPIWPFISRILTEHPEAQAALARADQAAAEARALAAPLYNPSIELGAEDVNGAPGRPSTYDVGVAYTIELGGKQAARERAGAGRAAAAAAGGRSARNELAARILGLLSTRESAIALEENARRQDGAAERLANALTRSYSAGDVGSADNALGEILRSQAAADLNAAQAQRAAVETALVSLCGCSVAALPRLPDIPPAVDALAEGEIRRLAEAAYGVDMARNDVAAAEGDLDIARAGRVPDPTISLGFGQDERQSMARLGLSIPIPVINDGSREVDAKNSGVIVALRERELALRTSFVRVQSAYETYQLSRSSWETWRRSAASNDQRLAALEKLRSAGELSLTDFVVQFRETLEAEKQGVGVRDAAWQAYAEWLAASSQALTLAGGN